MLRLFSVLWMCVFAAFLTPVAPVRAQSPTPTPTPSGPLRMSLDSPLALTKKPLSIVARRGRWFPVAVLLENKSSTDEYAGEVRLSLRSNSDFESAPNDFYAPVVMPPNSRKVVWLYGRLERPNADFINVTLSGRGFSSLQAGAQIVQPEEAQRIVAVISDGGDGLVETLRGLRDPKLYRATVDPQIRANLPPLRALEAARDLVPDRWIGFDSVDAIVLGDFPHTALAPLQLDALRGYAHGGGTLVVTGGANAPRLAGSPLKELWPLQPSGSTVASESQTRVLARSYVPNPQNAADRLGGAALPLLVGTPLPDAIVKGSASPRPLIVWRNAGAGRILMLAFDPAQPPFKGWSGQDALWSQLFNFSARPARLDTLDEDALFGTDQNFNTGFNPYTGEVAQTSLTERLLSALSRARQLRLPPVSQIAWFLALYVFFLVPVNYAVLRLLDRREWAWITIPVIVIGFSVFAYSQALSIRGRAILTRQIDLVQSSPGASQARVDSLFWLFSPGNRRYDLTSSGQNAVIADFFGPDSASQGPFSLLQPEDGSGFKAEGALLRQWASRAFVSQSLVDVKQGLTLNGTTIQNNTPYDLKGAVLVTFGGARASQPQLESALPPAPGAPPVTTPAPAAGQVRALGNLNKGARVDARKTTAQRASGDLAGAITRAGKLDSFFDASMLSNGVPAQALSFALDSPPQNGALLIAWSERAVSPIRIDQARDTEVTLWVWRIARVPNGL